MATARDIFIARMQPLFDEHGLGEVKRKEELDEFHDALCGKDERYAGLLNRWDRGWERVEWVKKKNTFMFVMREPSPWYSFRSDISQSRGGVIAALLFGNDRKVADRISDLAHSLYEECNEERFETVEHYLHRAHEASSGPERHLYLAAALYADAVKRLQN